MTESACTPGQTVGPFFGLGLPYPGDRDLVGAAHPGAIKLHGTVYDGAGDGVPDALVELWQPDSDGRIPRAAGSLRRDGAGFTGWGRAATDSDGQYAFTTVAPGCETRAAAVLCDHRVRAGAVESFVHPRLSAGHRPGADPLLATLDTARRASLLCVAESGSGRAGYRFDIHLQGPNETCSWRTGTIGDDQPAVARGRAGRRAHDGSGAAAVDGRGGIRLVGCPGRRRPGSCRVWRRRPVAPGR